MIAHNWSFDHSFECVSGRKPTSVGAGAGKDALSSLEESLERPRFVARPQSEGEGRGQVGRSEWEVLLDAACKHGESGSAYLDVGRHGQQSQQDLPAGGKCQRVIAIITIARATLFLLFVRGLGRRHCDVHVLIGRLDYQQRSFLLGVKLLSSFGPRPSSSSAEPLQVWAE